MFVTLAFVCPLWVDSDGGAERYECLLPGPAAYVPFWRGTDMTAARED